MMNNKRPILGKRLPSGVLYYSCPEIHQLLQCPPYVFTHVSREFKNCVRNFKSSHGNPTGINKRFYQNLIKRGEEKLSGPIPVVSECVIWFIFSVLLF